VGWGNAPKKSCANDFALICPQLRLNDPVHLLFAKSNLIQAARSFFSYRFIITIGLYAAMIAACFDLAFEVRFAFAVAPEY